MLINSKSVSYGPIKTGAHNCFIYINDLHAGFISISKYADDTKLEGNAANPASVKSLYQDFKGMEEWSEASQMMFNTNKCSKAHQYSEQICKLLAAG